LFSISVPDELCASWKSFDPSEVRIFYKNMVSLPSNTPRKVLLNDKIITFLKLIRHSNKQPLINKLDIYRKINRAQLNNKIRILCLYGLVQNNDGVTLGLLLTYINYRHITLLYIVEPGTEVLLRER
ncbi:hypothetical protein FOC4_g10013259, partial [Fusarium odoratissimum]